MKQVKYIFIISLMALSSIIMPGCQNKEQSAETTEVSESAKAELSALIVTGQNNHKWEVSSPVLKDILVNSGIFTADIIESPAQGEDMSGFSPDFSSYDLVVLDYTGDAWPDGTKTAFEDYVKQGGGVVVYHAANNAFRDWKEYNVMTGLGGWGGRNEEDGPYVRWKDGEFVKDMSPGRGGSHGRQHAFRIVNRVTDHPITKGLPEEWMHAQDELYSELRGPAENMTVLSTAFADTAYGGTGEHEPILMTINYGKGRIFHTALGHAGSPGNNPAMECVGFIVTLQRGAEWAATGKVTQEIPEEFPHFNVLSSWKKYRPLSLQELLNCLKDYHQGDNRSCMQDLTNLIRKSASDESKLAELEKELITFLGSSASNDSKNEICREISLWGTKASLPVLKKLMKEEDTKEMARFAKERISGKYSN